MQTQYPVIVKHQGEYGVLIDFIDETCPFDQSIEVCQMVVYSPVSGTYKEFPIGDAQKMGLLVPTDGSILIP